MYKRCGRRVRKSNLICISALNNKFKIRGTTPPPPPQKQLTPEGRKEHLGEEGNFEAISYLYNYIYMNSNENKSYSVML